MRDISIYDVAYGIQTGKLKAGAKVKLRSYWTIEDLSRVNRVATAHGLQVICKLKGMILMISAGGDAATLPSCYVSPQPSAWAAGVKKSVRGGDK